MERRVYRVRDSDGQEYLFEWLDFTPLRVGEIGYDGTVVVEVL